MNVCRGVGVRTRVAAEGGRGMRDVLKKISVVFFLGFVLMGILGPALLSANEESSADLYKQKVGKYGVVEGVWAGDLGVAIYKMEAVSQLESGITAKGIFQVVKMVVANRGSAPLEVDLNLFEVVDENGHPYGWTIAETSGDEGAFSLAPGEKRNVTLAFDIPSGAKITELRFQDKNSGQTGSIAFKVQKEVIYNKENKNGKP